MLKWFYELTHTPEEVCEKYGPVEGDVMETSGNGQFWTCKRCGYSGHTPELR